MAHGHFGFMVKLADNAALIRPTGIFLLCAFSALTHAAPDIFSTERYLADSQFHTPAEPNICAKERIQKALTLADVVDLSLCNNPQTRSLWAASRAQAAQLGSSMSSFLPSLSGPISLSGSRNSTGNTSATGSQSSIGVTLSYLLYDFGGREANVESAKQLLLATNATRDATLQTVYLSAVQAYYALLTAQGNVRAAQAAEAAARQTLNAATARYQAGSGTQADRLQAQTAWSQATLNRIRAEGEVANAEGVLANGMGFVAGQRLVLVDPGDAALDVTGEQNVAALIERALHNRPDLRAAEAQIKAAEAQMVVIQASGMPSVNLSGTLSQNHSQTGGVSSSSRGNSVGVSVSVPWFSGYKNTYQNRAAAAQLEGKVADRDRLANQVALEVWRAYQTLRTNSQALRAAEDLLASAEQAEKMSSGRYQAGIGNLLDTLNAQTALANARAQQIAALYSLQASRFALVQAMGVLDGTLETTKK